MRANEGKCLCFTCTRAKVNWSMFEDGSDCNGCAVHDWLMSQRDISQKPYLRYERCISKQRRNELEKLLHAMVFSALSKDSERAYAKEMYIFNSAENIANYIMSVTSEIFVRRIDISGVGGKFYLRSNGYSIDICSDENFLINEIQPAIIPLQSGEKRPGHVNAMTLTPIEASWLGEFFAPF